MNDRLTTLILSMLTYFSHNFRSSGRIPPLKSERCGDQFVIYLFIYLFEQIEVLRGGGGGGQLFR